MISPLLSFSLAWTLPYQHRCQVKTFLLFSVPSLTATNSKILRLTPLHNLLHLFPMITLLSFPITNMVMIYKDAIVMVETKIDSDRGFHQYKHYGYQNHTSYCCWKKYREADQHQAIMSDSTTGPSSSIFTSTPITTPAAIALFSPKVYIPQDDLIRLQRLQSTTTGIMLLLLHPHLLTTIILLCLIDHRL